MGSEASIASIASITGKSGTVDLSWTKQYNRKTVDKIQLWASPCRYENEDIIRGNEELLRVLHIFNDKRIIMLRQEDTTLLERNVHSRERKGQQTLYKFSAYVVVYDGQMRIIAEYQGKQLQVATDFKDIVPQENLMKRDMDHKTINLSLFEGLKWRELKKTIESIEIQKRTGRWSEMSDTDSWTDRDERIQDERDRGIHLPDSAYCKHGIQKTKRCEQGCRVSIPNPDPIPSDGSGPNKWLIIVLIILAVAGFSALIWPSSSSKSQTESEKNTLSYRSATTDHEKYTSEANNGGTHSSKRRSKIS